MTVKIKQLCLLSFLLGVSWSSLANNVNNAKLLADADANRGKAKSGTCVACHSTDGNSASDAFPKIAGQHSGYLLKQMMDFKNKKRHDAVMFGMVATLSDQDMADLAHYYSKQKTSNNSAKLSEETLKLAESIYRGGKNLEKITACSACHGPSGQGIDSANFPKLSFQHAAYLKTQLLNFRQYAFDRQTGESSANSRSNDLNEMMRDVVKDLSNKEIEALSEYIAGLH